MQRGEAAASFISETAVRRPPPWSKEAAWAHRDHDPKSNPKAAILGCSSRRRDGLRAPRKWCLAWEKGLITALQINMGAWVWARIVPESAVQLLSRGFRLVIFGKR
jgi:hypothetical protein